jgi:inosine/xanthosine triphosphatase
MKIGVGTTNAAKAAPVYKALSRYPVLWGGQIELVKVHTSVDAQPKFRELTLRGAMERAYDAFGIGRELGVGIESGVYCLDDGTMLDECVCALWDGKYYCLGISSAFVVPPAIAKGVNEGLELNDAFRAAGFTDDINAKQKDGIVKLLTSGRVDREKFTAQALTMAMAQYEYPELYGRGRRVVVSICSRQKDTDQKPLVAFERYTGSHVRLASEYALVQGLRFFILSGKHGLLHADELVEPYDHRLVAKEVPALGSRITEQLKRHNIGEVRFYTKRKPTWEPYYAALDQACAESKVHLIVRELDEDD